MIACRKAEPKDARALIQLALDSNQPVEDIPDLVFICEDQDEEKLLAMVGIRFDQPGLVIVGGYVVPPDVYNDRELRRAVADDLRAFVHGWLLARGCRAYVCNVSKRNTRMQRWLESRGARRYAKKNGAYWYVWVIDPAALEEKAA